MRFSPLLAGSLAVGLLAGTLDAQARGDAPRARTVISTFDDERPVIGVNTASSGERDTLGLLVVAVTPGGPAERAGIEEGHRIAEVNGVSLRLAAIDAGEDDMQGLTTRRLVRELRKVEAGAEVDLRVFANGQLRSVKVKTVAVEDLPRTRTVGRSDDEERAVIGVNLGSADSRRDTLGVLITHVTTDGPAEKAGLIEGDRIAAINGIDVRVPAAEAGEGAISMAKANRFSRELRKLKAGDEVELRVFSAGQYKNVRIRTQAREDVYSSEGRSRAFIGTSLRLPEILGHPGERMRIVVPPDVRMRTPDPRMRIHGVPDPRDLQLQGTPAPRAPARTPVVTAGYTPDASAQAGRSFAPWTDQLPVSQRIGVGVPSESDPGMPVASGIVMATGSGQHYVIELPGMQLAKVGADLADYLGDGTEQGLLVLEVDDVWAPLRSGDVVLAVNGRAVRRGDAALIALDTAGANTIEVIRRGRHLTLRVDCR